MRRGRPCRGEFGARRVTEGVSLLSSCQLKASNRVTQGPKELKTPQLSPACIYHLENHENNQNIVVLQSGWALLRKQSYLIHMSTLVCHWLRAAPRAY